MSALVNSTTSYRDLQAIAKSRGIKANLKKADLLSALSLEADNDNDKENPAPVAVVPKSAKKAPKSVQKAPKSALKGSQVAFADDAADLLSALSLEADNDKENPALVAVAPKSAQKAPKSVQKAPTSALKGSQVAFADEADSTVEDGGCTPAVIKAATTTATPAPVTEKTEFNKNGAFRHIHPPPSPQVIAGWPFRPVTGARCQLVGHNR